MSWLLFLVVLIVMSSLAFVTIYFGKNYIRYGSSLLCSGFVMECCPLEIYYPFIIIYKQEDGMILINTSILSTILTSCLINGMFKV